MKTYTIKRDGDANRTVQVGYGPDGGVEPLRHFPTRVDADIWISTQKAEDAKREGRQWPRRIREVGLTYSERPKILASWRSDQQSQNTQNPSA